MPGKTSFRGWAQLVRWMVVTPVLAAAIVFLPLTATKGRAQGNAPPYKLLYSFTGGADGGGPEAVIRDAAGDLYGTTQQGGNANSPCPYFFGCGVVFSLDPAGNETALYTFSGGTDGATPAAGLIRDAAGNLYGTTLNGGDTGGPCPNYDGCGLVFKVDPAGSETVLYTFTGGADGGSPFASLVRDAGGNLYGTTSAGGAYGWGVVFMLDPSGNETVLHTFTGGSDGGNPSAGLLRDGAGNLYGTTYNGGNTSGTCPYGPSGCGVVFKVDQAENETVLYTFTGGSDGANPTAGLVRDAGGNLYGTTQLGGNLSCLGYGCGVVFKLDAAGNETVLYTFMGGTDGGNPEASLILDASGNLGGTTTAGGTAGWGVVFKVDQKGNESVLHDFCSEPNCEDGSLPYAGLFRDRAGAAYGTAFLGGTYDHGVVFSLTHNP